MYYSNMLHCIKIIKKFQSKIKMNLELCMLRSQTIRKIKFVWQRMAMSLWLVNVTRDCGFSLVLYTINTCLQHNKHILFYNYLILPVKLQEILVLTIQK